MKKFNVGAYLGFVLSATTITYAQSQLFEQELAALHPYLGFDWNSEIMQYSVGVDYTIEGRTTLGVSGSLPVKDSLSITTLKTYKLNPYAMFEFIEPGNLTIFSFAVRADFIYEGATRDEDVVDYFTRTTYGAGPVFALRIQTSEKMTVIPEAAYQLQYVSWRSSYLPPDTAKAIPYDDDNFWHEASGGVNLVYRINERNALNIEPKLVIKVGKGRKSTDLISATFAMGYLISF